jgi:hypothetical protein
MSKIITNVFLAAIIATAALFLAASKAKANGNDDNLFITQQKVVEFSPNHLYGGGGYYSIGQFMTDRQNLDEDKIDRMIVLLEKILEKIDGKTDDGGDDSGGNDDNGGGDGGDGDNNDPNIPSDLDQKVYNIFVDKCSQCHSEGGTGGGGFELLGKDETTGNPVLYDLPLQERVLIYDLTADIALRERGKNRMPKGSPRLDEDSIETLRLWMIDKAEQLYETY